MTSQVFRYSYRDAYLVALSLLHGLALVVAPSVPVIAIGVWWSSNTISHHFLHLPFFRSNGINRIYALYLTAVLGIPQSIWRDRHLAHHRGLSMRLRWTRGAATEILLIVAIWGMLALANPGFFIGVYLPGTVLGLVLCYLHGYFEHVGETTSNYGSFYNFAFFNDGYHVEHHENPSRHWTRMSDSGVLNAKTSRWPAVLRWIEFFNLETLERIVLRSRLIQYFLLRTHERALRTLVANLSGVRRVTIVGGGMYPRSAILLRRLFPAADIQILDCSLEHLEMAKAFVDESIRLEHELFRCEGEADSDLVVIPLSFTGCRETVYRNPPARAVLVHDWIWNKRGRSAVVSVLLLKRLNLILR
jgi:hypothetical protein